MPEASADPKLVESFSTTDKNGDGYLDNDEYDKRTDAATVVGRRVLRARAVSEAARGFVVGLPVAGGISAILGDAAWQRGDSTGHG